MKMVFIMNNQLFLIKYRLVLKLTTSKNFKKKISQILDFISILTTNS